jgi:hypothetical protein
MGMDQDFAEELLLVIDSLAVAIAQDKEEKRSLSYLTTLAPGVKPQRVPSVLSLEDIQHDMGDCQRCSLHAGRKNVVFWHGKPAGQPCFCRGSAGS